MSEVSALQIVMPKAPLAWILAFSTEMGRSEINTPARIAMFMANVAHESQQLTHLEENLNYSAERLVAVWPKRFTADRAAEYAHQPERIANLVYANRMGNGAEESGDGWLFRGRGPLQRTGREAYREDSEVVGHDLLEDPDALAKIPQVGCASACNFFVARGCLPLADAGDHRAVRRIVNGGELGLDDCIRYAAEVLKALSA